MEGNGKGRRRRVSFDTSGLNILPGALHVLFPVTLRTTLRMCYLSRAIPPTTSSGPSCGVGVGWLEKGKDREEGGEKKLTEWPPPCARHPGQELARPSHHIFPHPPRASAMAITETTLQSRKPRL